MERSVLYVDVAAFPIAVERVLDPALRFRPVALAPPGTARGLILVPSLEAQGEGVRAGMPVQEALRRCPGLLVRPPDEPLYRRAAAAVLALLGGYSPLVEPARRGQAFLDLTGTARLFGDAKDAAARIRRELDARLRLAATVGVATNKLVSRMATRVIRPDGLCDIFPGAEASFLAPLPVRLLPEAERQTPERFEDLGIGRVRDLLALSPPQLQIAFGRHGERLRRQALGLDDSPVRPPAACPRVVEDETLAEDSNEAAVLLRALWRLCERAGARLRRLEAVPRRLRVTVRYAGSMTARREAILAIPTAADRSLFEAARGLLERARARRERVRFLELACLGLSRGPRQLALFGPEACAGTRRPGAADVLAEAIDRIRGRFGADAIVPGRLLEERAP
jgi:DNA polymerase IV